MVYVFLAEGFEEIEALSVVDILRRAQLQVKTVGVYEKTVTGAHNISVETDILIGEVDITKASALVLPGGMPGAVNLYNSQKLCDLIIKAANNFVPLCAICAAPEVFGKLGLLNGRDYTCYPGFQDQSFGGNYTKLPVCTCFMGEYPLVTANGPASAADFAFAILNLLTEDNEKSISIAKGMQFEF